MCKVMFRFGDTWADNGPPFAFGGTFRRGGGYGGRQMTNHIYPPSLQAPPPSPPTILHLRPFPRTPPLGEIKHAKLWSNPHAELEQCNGAGGKDEVGRGGGDTYEGRGGDG